MTGGSLNLASASGAGDDIININPQITFFKKVYKRHTNFGLETREVSDSTNNSVNFGESVTYNITKTGTLIIHPASWPFIHKGYMPLSSDKYILTTWLCWTS